MRLPSGSAAYRDRLLDAMASLLVDLHRGGVYWGDCSLANTLFRRDGDKIQAYLVDAETSEVHPAPVRRASARTTSRSSSRTSPSGWPTWPRMQGRDGRCDEAIAAAESVRTRYRAPLGRAPRRGPARAPDDRHAVAARVRRLNDLGFSVDEIELEPGDRAGKLRLRVAVTTRRFHVHELERLTGIRALEGQARILLNDLREYRAWLEWFEKRSIDRTGGRRALARATSTSRPSPGCAAPSARIATWSRPTATCSSTSGSCPRRPAATSGWSGPIESYLAIGAPAPEVGVELDDPALAADPDPIAGGRRRPDLTAARRRGHG